MVDWIAGLVLLAVSVAGGLWIERRRFYRRNPGLGCRYSARSGRPWSPGLPRALRSCCFA